MNENLKNGLAAVAIIFMLVVGYAFFSYSWAYSKSIQPSSYRSFSVTGEGRVIASPDIATFTFSIITEGGKNIASLQDSNNKKSAQAIDYLKKQGIEAKDIKTLAVNVEPRYQYFNCIGGTVCPAPEITGYTVRQVVSVKVRDLAKAGTLIGGVVANGANSVSELNFTVEERDKVVNQAKAEAITKAKEKAATLAKAGGFRLGKIIAIDDSGSYPIPMAADGRGGAGFNMEKSAPSVSVAPVEPGSQEIREFVTLRYEIK